MLDYALYDRPQFSTGKPASEKDERHWYQKNGVGLPVLLIVVIFIAAAASGGGNTDETATPTTSTAPSDNGGSTTTGAPPTTAAKAEKVEATLDEFNKVETGMTKAQVEEIFGGIGTSSSGTEIAGSTIESYTWNGDGLGDTVIITFDNDNVSSKISSAWANDRAGIRQLDLGWHDALLRACDQPPSCPNGRRLGARTMLVGWLPCGCAGGGGHRC